MSKRNTWGWSWTYQGYFQCECREFALTPSERHVTGERSTILGSTCQDKRLVEQFHRPSSFPKNVHAFFKAIYEVRMLFCNPLIVYAPLPYICLAHLSRMNSKSTPVAFEKVYGSHSYWSCFVRDLTKERARRTVPGWRRRVISCSGNQRTYRCIANVPRSLLLSIIQRTTWHWLGVAV